MDKSHWSMKNERGNRFFLTLTAYIVRYCPAWLLHLSVSVVVTYFFLSAKQQRRYIAEYQNNLFEYYLANKKSNLRTIWRQFYQFGIAIIDRFAVWQHKITYQDLDICDPDHVYDDIISSHQKNKKGQLLICSHLGNIEICRALVLHNQDFILNVLVHNAHAIKFNQALKKAGASDINLIQVSELDMNIMLDLQARIDRGEWIAIAADRTPIRGEKTVVVNFLGKSAELPQGPWLLANILKAATVGIFCYKVKNKYQLHLKKLFDPPQISRNQRQQFIKECSQFFAYELEHHCQQAPYQWFNFFQFWNHHEKTQ